MNESACRTERVVVASEIVLKVEDVVAQTTDVLSRMKSRLSSVTRESVPELKDGVGSAEPDYPPLFHKLNDELSAMQRMLSQMQDILNRVELED